MTRNLTLAFLLAALYSAPAYAVIKFDWATVNNPGNRNDWTGYGGVDYCYNISKHEVTNTQYTEFLNAVAATDLFELYSPYMESSPWGGIIRSGAPGGYSYSVKAPAVGQGSEGSDYSYQNKPVVYVSFFDSMRFVNWLHNGQGSGDTESGAYTIGNGIDDVRSADAKFWIPSDDEWYKAAYYAPVPRSRVGVYYAFPTSTSTLPNNNPPSADTGNSANFYSGSQFTTDPRSYTLTDVGAYARSASPYGTFDQGGNVWEWTERTGIYGGSGTHGTAYYLRANFLRRGLAPWIEYDVGFRVAGIVPEPSTVVISAFGAAGLLMRRRRLS